ncbi:HAMP domain-containing sensor histidine kinase [Anaerolentibacter hominis]|uniref:sensor histidine kinase n=1 Tax=Anaerolentibacter hominis TaxID=3079009 RepID=UPI0031B85360
MKSFAKYMTKYFKSFSIFIFLLAILNVIIFVGTFYGAVTNDYGDTSPRRMLEKTAADSSISGISNETQELLHRNGIWAMYLNQYGNCVWSVDLPSEIPVNYTVQDVAVFSRGYLKNYPVFVQNDGEGLLVLGYPEGTYTKLISNYYSSDMVKAMPVYFAGILVVDILLLFAAYYISKLKMIKDIQPLISSIEMLSNGKPVSLAMKGELSDVADSVSKASHILSRQNEARANWISGVSHDIRTPLSMIMGYAGQIADDESAGCVIRDKAKIVQRQSVKIKELVQDLNLVSKLEYDMQPLHKETIRVSRLLRAYAAELLNTGFPEHDSLDVEIRPAAESARMDCDSRLITRAINNLVQNSIRHNPQGCKIQISLDCSDTSVTLSVSDNGVGLMPDKQKELEEKPHYMESTDERLDLRHGLGLILVRQITEVHGGSLKIESKPHQGYRTILTFPKQNRETA